jgi:hypothetical protein
VLLLTAAQRPKGDRLSSPTGLQLWIKLTGNSRPLLFIVTNLTLGDRRIIKLAWLQDAIVLPSLNYCKVL